MPVELTIVESVTELETTVIEVVLESASAPGPAGPGVPVGGTDGQVLTKTSATDYATAWEDPTGGGGGAPADADYLVGTANGTLSAEIVVGTSPGGELGGTWASPTVDATHSGSSHASVQAAAEATAASELATHSADTTGVHGITDTSALALSANHPTNATFNDHSARHENGGADEISIAGLDGTSTELAAHLADTADAHDASAISFTPNGSIAATDVQAAIQEVRDEAGGGGAPTDATYITQTANGTLSNEQALSALSTGIVKVTTTTGVLSTAVANTDYAAATHASRHQNGGADEISVAGLSGELADAQPVTVRKNTGADVGTRSRLNFIEGSNVTLTIADDAGSDELDITIASTGGGGGGTGTVLLMPGAATLPDGSTGNAAPALSRHQGTESNPKKHFLFLGFDGAGSTVEYAWWDFVMPADYSSGGSLDIYWMANATSNAVKWQARVGAVTADDADTPIEHASAAAATVTTNVNATEARRLTKSTISLTMDSAAAGDLMFVTVFRDPADGSDTATVDAELVSAAFTYTRA